MTNLHLLICIIKDTRPITSRRIRYIRIIGGGQFYCCHLEQDTLEASISSFLRAPAQRVNRSVRPNRLLWIPRYQDLAYLEPEPIYTQNQCFGSGSKSARICIKKCLLAPDPHGQMRIRIQEVIKPRKY